MDAEHSLLASVRERPDDHTPRLVLADFYEDHGMHHEATYHRGVVASKRAAAMSRAVLDDVRTEHAAHRVSGGHLGASGTAELSARWAANDANTGEVDRAIRNHLTAATKHEYAAGTDARQGYKEPHHRAADAHREAAETLASAFGVPTTAVSGDSHMEYRERAGARRRTWVQLHAYDGRLSVTANSDDPPLDRTRTHPADFHAQYEPHTEAHL